LENGDATGPLNTKMTGHQPVAGCRPRARHPELFAPCTAL